MVEQPFIHKLQTLLEHRAGLEQNGLLILIGMALNLIHVPILLLQPVTYLQQGSVHLWVIERCTDLQRLLYVVLQPLAELIWHSLACIVQALHLLNADLGHVHQTFHFLFGIVLELHTKILTPQL